MAKARSGWPTSEAATAAPVGRTAGMTATRSGRRTAAASRSAPTARSAARKVSTSSGRREARPRRWSCASGPSTRSPGHRMASGSPSWLPRSPTPRTSAARMSATTRTSMASDGRTGSCTWSRSTRETSSDPSTSTCTSSTSHGHRTATASPSRPKRRPIRTSANAARCGSWTFQLARRGGYATAPSSISWRGTPAASTSSSSLRTATANRRRTRCGRSSLLTAASPDASVRKRTSLGARSRRAPRRRDEWRC